MIVDQAPGAYPKTPEVVLFCRVNWLLWRPCPSWMKAVMNASKYIPTYLFELQFAHHLAVRTGVNYMKNFCVAVIAGALVLTVSGSRAHSEKLSSATPAATSRTGSHDFDFLIGEWRVHHHRLKPGGREWVDFDGTCSNSKLMDDEADMEEHVLNAPNGAYRAVALRAYDPKTGQWAIWWLDERYPSRPLDPPAKGRFENGIGNFYADYKQDGKPMRGRLHWSNITPTSARFAGVVIRWRQDMGPELDHVVGARHVRPDTGCGGHRRLVRLRFPPRRVACSPSISARAGQPSGVGRRRRNGQQSRSHARSREHGGTHHQRTQRRLSRVGAALVRSENIAMVNLVARRTHSPRRT